MYEHKKLQKLDEYFLDLNCRKESGVFFYRLNGYSENVGNFIQRYYETARLTGVVLEGKIPNPDEKNLSYYSEMMGMTFLLDLRFFTDSLRKWLPRANECQRSDIAAALYETLDSMRLDGKTENMIKNAYIKFMCWLYYKFERIVNGLGNEKLPKILYEGNISFYEWKLLTILSRSGSDVIILQYHGDDGYLALDAKSEHSTLYPMNGLEAFPDYFSVKWMRSELEKQLKIQRIYGEPPGIKNETNTWIQGAWLKDVQKAAAERGNEKERFYNCFYRINGVADKLTYINELYRFYLHLKSTKRKLAVINQEIEKPTVEEIAQIKRSHYPGFEQMASGLSANIIDTANIELQKLMRKAFLDILVEENKLPDRNLNKLMNKAIYLLCWLRRYQKQLFANWKLPEIACFIYLGGCQDENESMFVRLLSRLPVDVIILVPDRNANCVLRDSLLCEINEPDTLAVEKFPCDREEIQMGTAAYHAERELDTIMYQDSGLYRNQQCSKANTIVLKTIYEEIAILWNQELKYRPNFGVVDGVVSIPAIFAKVSGVKDRDNVKYWVDIKKLKTEDTLLIKEVPFIRSTDFNPVRQYAAEFIKNGKLQRSKIKTHKAYRYSVLREEMQEHMLDKLQLLLDLKSIKGTFENGTEYTIVSAALNLDKAIVRLIQKFDFTKKNPKLIYINTTETMNSLEDSIVAAFLNLVGFDIVFFVPTGYQTVENHYNQKLMEEHQIGEYMYDLIPPDFAAIPIEKRPSWREKLFKR